MAVLRITRYEQHGASGTPEWRVWMAIKTRCYNTKASNYDRYGAKGIIMYQPWIESFEAFLSYVGLKPSPDHTIDRWPNQSGNYEPGNVRWASTIEQNRNRSNTANLTFNGRTQSLTEWAEEVGLTYGALQSRIQRGWTIEKALTDPTMSISRIGTSPREIMIPNLPEVFIEYFKSANKTAFVRSIGLKKKDTLLKKFRQAGLIPTKDTI